VSRRRFIPMTEVNEPNYCTHLLNILVTDLYVELLICLGELKYNLNIADIFFILNCLKNLYRTANAYFFLSKFLTRCIGGRFKKPGKSFGIVPTRGRGSREEEKSYYG
jgi:hypothetical protein